MTVDTQDVRAWLKRLVPGTSWDALAPEAFHYGFNLACDILDELRQLVGRSRLELTGDEPAMVFTRWLEDEKRRQEAEDRQKEAAQKYQTPWMMRAFRDAPHGAVVRVRESDPRSGNDRRATDTPRRGWSTEERRGVLKDRRSSR